METRPHEAAVNVTFPSLPVLAVCSFGRVHLYATLNATKSCTSNNKTQVSFFRMCPSSCTRVYPKQRTHLKETHTATFTMRKPASKTHALPLLVPTLETLPVVATLDLWQPARCM